MLKKFTNNSKQISPQGQGFPDDKEVQSFKHNQSKISILLNKVEEHAGTNSFRQQQQQQQQQQ